MIAFLIVPLVLGAAAGSTTARKKSPPATKKAAAATAEATPAPLPPPVEPTPAPETVASTAPVAAGAIAVAPKSVPSRGRSSQMRGEMFLAPSVASFGEAWVDEMALGVLDTTADRHAWLPSFALGARTPVGDGLAIEADGATTRFQARVEGGSTHGWIGHAAARVSWDAGAIGAEAGVLARAAQVTEASGAVTTASTAFPSVELRVRRSGVEYFTAAWNDPVLPYDDAGWLRAGMRRELGGMAWEVSAGVDHFLAGKKSTGPVVEGHLLKDAGRGTWLGVACRAADDPMAAFVIQRRFR